MFHNRGDTLYVIDNAVSEALRGTLLADVASMPPVPTPTPWATRWVWSHSTHLGQAPATCCLLAKRCVRFRGRGLNREPGKKPTARSFGDATTAARRCAPPSMPALAAPAGLAVVAQLFPRRRSPPRRRGRWHPRDGGRARRHEWWRWRRWWVGWGRRRRWKRGGVRSASRNHRRGCRSATVGARAGRALGASGGRGRCRWGQPTPRTRGGSHDVAHSAAAVVAGASESRGGRHHRRRHHRRQGRHDRRGHRRRRWAAPSSTPPQPAPHLHITVAGGM